jgi:hypothetical protein
MNDMPAFNPNRVPGIARPTDEHYHAGLRTHTAPMPPIYTARSLNFLCPVSLIWFMLA